MQPFRCVSLRYHTFVAPLPRVRQVTLAALRRMQGEVFPQKEKAAKPCVAPTIVASARDWQAEIELHPTSPRITRMRVLTKEGVVSERNTASEILSRVADSLHGDVGWLDPCVKA